MKINSVLSLIILSLFSIHTNILGQSINTVERTKENLSKSLVHERYKIAEELINSLFLDYKKNNRLNEFALYLNDLAFQLNSDKKLDASIYISKKNIEITKKYIGEKDTIIGLSYDFLGNNFLQKGIADSALLNYELAINNFKENGVQSKYAFALIGKVVSHYYLGQIKEMEAPLSEATFISSILKTRDETLTGLCFQLAGVLYDALGDFDKAINLYKNAINTRLVDSKLDSLSISTEYNNLGAAYLIKGDYDLAIDYLEKSILLTNKIGADYDALVSSYINIILSYSRKEDYPNAIVYLNKAKEIITKHKSIKQSPIYQDFLNVACYIYNDTSTPDEAIKYATELSSKTANHPELFYLSNLHLGHAYSIKSKFKTAGNYFEKAYIFFQKNEKKIKEGRNEIFTYLSQYYYDSGKFDKALEIAQNGLIELSRDSSLINKYSNPSPNITQHKSALLKLLFLKALALNKLYLTNKDQQYLRHSFDTYELGTQVIDHLRNDHISAGSKHFLLKKAIPFYENVIATAREMYRVTDDPEYLEKAFLFNQKGKAILLLDRLNDAEAKVFSNIPDSILQQEKKLKQDLAFYQKHIFDELQYGNDADTLKLEVWNEKVFNLKRSLEELNSYLEKRFPQYFDLKYRPTLPSVSEVRKNGLKKNELYLEYFMGDSTIYTFVISDRGINIFDLQNRETFQNDLTAIITQVSTMPIGNINEIFLQFSQSAYRLYQQLIEPAIKESPHFSSLTIVPHGQLSFLPFEILLSEPISASSHVNFGKLPYLIKRHPINYNSSAGMLMRTIAENPADQKTIKCTAFVPTYTLGQSDHRNNLAALPGAEREVELLSKYFPGDYYHGTNATEANFKAISKNYNLIHVAMHGVANQESTLYSKLIFNENEDSTEDNVLHTYEIYGLMLQAKLVVLSSCQSGFGKYIHGEGIVSLAQGFLQAGSQAVTMSLWEAQDGSTAYIMGKYYRNLHEGMAKNEALQQAKLEYLAQSSHQKHPFFWAAFVNIGNPSPIAESNYLSAILLAGLSFLAILTLYLFRYHKKK